MTRKTRIILLADDDPEDQEILEDVIAKLEPDVHLHKVDNGKQAVEYLADCSDLPCLVILDYKMPIYNAAEVLEQIGGDSRLRPVPKVVWSSSRQPEHVKSCLDKGALNYFVKPNKMSELTGMVREMLDICMD